MCAWYYCLSSAHSKTKRTVRSTVRRWWDLRLLLPNIIIIWDCICIYICICTACPSQKRTCSTGGIRHPGFHYGAAVDNNSLSWCMVCVLWCMMAMLYLYFVM
jgi:hypothetical protein